MFVDIMCPNCRSRLLHYHSRFFRKDVVRCPGKCGFQEEADTMLDVVGMKWQRAEERLSEERLRAKINGVHVKLNSVAASVGGSSATKKAVLDAIFKFHPDRNPKGLDANEVLMVLNKLKGML